MPGWPVLYDITEYQEELHLPKDALLQEVTIRWWSVIAILTNLINNIEPVGQALKKCDKVQMNLNLQEQHQVVKIINLLMEFKFVQVNLARKIM